MAFKAISVDGISATVTWDVSLNGAQSWHARYCTAPEALKGQDAAAWEHLFPEAGITNDEFASKNKQAIIRDLEQDTDYVFQLWHDDAEKLTTTCHTQNLGETRIKGPREPEEYIHGDSRRTMIGKIKDYTKRELNALILGATGAGKTALFNTLYSAFGEEKQSDVPFGWAIESDDTVTFKLTKDALEKNPEEDTYFVLWNTYGYKSNNYQNSILESILDGHIDHGFEERDEQDFLDGRYKERDYYISNPTLEDKVHVVIYVVAAEEAAREDWKEDEQLKRFFEISEILRRRDIMGVIAVTQLDKVDETLLTHPENMYTSKFVQRSIATVQNRTGWPIGSIFPVINNCVSTGGKRDYVLESLAIEPLYQAFNLADLYYHKLEKLRRRKLRRKQRTEGR